MKIKKELAPNKMKLLGINLSKHVQRPYVENCKTLMKDIKDDLNKWTSYIERCNIVNMSILHNLIYRFLASQSVSQEAFFR